MSQDAASINLTNHFLIAMPGMEDGTLAKSVVYVCEHSERGALGLIINKPGDISMADLFQKVDLPLERKDLGVQPVFHGGPLQTERGFVLHEPVVVEGIPPEESLYASTLTVPGGPVPLDAHQVAELTAAVGACLDNVAVHVGEDAPAWVMVQDLGDSVSVTVRDEGPGIPDGRLDAAAADGRLGVSGSVRGRLADLGGEAHLTSGSFGTEWELAIPLG